MPTKKIQKNKFWTFGIIGGFVVLMLSTLIMFNVDKDDCQNQLSRILKYVNVQCSTYTHYNNSSEAQGVLRAIENVKQVSYHLQEDCENEDILNQDLLKDYTEKLWLHGIIVLDENYEEICSYYNDANIKKTVDSYLTKNTITDALQSQERYYSQKIHLDDNSYIDLAACARKDKPGIIVSYFYTSSEYARNYVLTLQSLLSGYYTNQDGTVMVVDQGKVIACNDVSKIGENTLNDATVQTIKKNADSEHIIHINDSHCYGLMVKQRSYYLYAYIPDSIVFSTLPLKLLLVLFIYSLFLALVWLLLRQSERKYEKLELEKDNLYKEQLIEAAKKAEVANVAKTEFLQRMSHDIRTPINGICGMVEMAEYYKDDLEKQAECRNKIKDASHLLLELVNEVLDMGKLESGEYVLEDRPFNLRQVCQEVISVIGKLAAERNIQIIMDDICIQHWNLIGSPIHVKRLFMNIMSNAVKYNKENGKIILRCHELESNDSNTALIQFACEDTGIGMSEEYQEKIYEPFTQENQSIQTKYGGTGLGMPIAKKLIEKMNGTLTFESKENEGTTFVVTIPFEIDQTITEDTSKQLEEDHSDFLKDINILLVEDNELNMEISQFVLENAGATITKAWNGKEALSIFESSEIESFDVILMDVMMPIMDGIEATKQIRALSRKDAHTIPIIAMTANAFSEDRLKTKQAGMNEHIAKPLNAEYTIQTIRNVINKSKK